jgi:hypothetical protein
MGGVAEHRRVDRRELSVPLASRPVTLTAGDVDLLEDAAGVIDRVTALGEILDLVLLLDGASLRQR